MKSYIDKLERVGVVFLKDQSIDLVLISLRKSYGQFIENFHMRNLDVTLTDLTEMLIVVEAEMLKAQLKQKFLRGLIPRFPWTLTMVTYVIKKRFLFPIEWEQPRAKRLIGW